MRKKNNKRLANQKTAKAKKNHGRMINHNHKDRLFIKLFGSPENKANMLSLYNALSGTEHEDEDSLELYTIEDVIYLGMKNDVGYLLDSYMVLHEQQSTYNPNMPLRGLLYHAKMYEKYIKQRDINLYTTVLKRIPTPQFYVFYNGDKETEDRLTLRLSDAFEKPIRDGEFEWTAVMLNINKGHNTELLHKCEMLNEYSMFIGKIKEDIKAGAEMEEAVYNAVDWAIGNDILSEYLQMHKSEVVGMLLTEYDEKKVWEDFKKDVYEEGYNSCENIINSLNNKLIELNRIDDLARSTTDKDFQKQLIKELVLNSDTPKL